MNKTIGCTQKSSFLFAGTRCRSYGKIFPQRMQILVIWDENLKINTDKDPSFLLGMLLVVEIWAWMRTSDTPDDEFEIDLLGS